MRELIENLRLKDYIIIAMLLALVGILSQSSRLIKYISPKHKTENYQIQGIGKILQIETRYSKKETLEGSKLKMVGYDIQLSYKVDDAYIEAKSTVLYNHYEVNKTKIDSIINVSTGEIPIMINNKRRESFILNTKLTK